MSLPRKSRSISLAIAVAVATSAADTRAQKFYPDDPIWQDQDRIPIPQPRAIELSEIADFYENSVLRRPEEPVAPATNVNTLGEVPDSSWFTNRIGRQDMSLAEIVRGPNQNGGPDRSTPLKVTSIKAAGVSPGVIVEDARGDTYLMKFDVLDYPQMATSAEVISTKLFHAFGYNVPENFLLFITRDELVPAPEATVEEDDRPVKLTNEHLAFLLDGVARLPDGTHPSMASKYVPGAPLGSFEFYGTRSDDANDIFRHENRRELRGLRVFSAWVNHNDSDAINTLNTHIPEGDLGYVRHYLIDFGTTLGSGAHRPEDRRAGHEYLIELDPIFKSAASAGVWDRPWRDADYPDLPSAGHFESEYFQPEKWKPQYPNPAFERMLLEDAFWAVKIVHRFTDDTIRAIVETGQYRNDAAELYLVETLIERRDKIVRYYFAQLNPLDRFRLERSDAVLAFDNLGLEAGLSTEASYTGRWFEYDNERNRLESLGQAETHDEAGIPIPESSADLLMVRIRTFVDGYPKWTRPVDVYLRNPDRSIVGIEREP